MKLALRHEESISVLEVSGSVDVRNFQILKAGITKLLQNGKNRIVLSFMDANELESDVVRELAIIDVYARELSGKIILAANSEELKESVKLFAKPPVIPILSNVELALDFFKKAEVQAEDEGDPHELKAQLAAKEKEVAALQARIQQLDPKVAQELRTMNAELKTKVTLLEQQVEDLTKERRQPVDAEGFLEKITALEESVKKLSGKEA